MVQICKRCRSANPRDALYCYRDGVLLSLMVGSDIPADGSAMNLGARPFSVPFVFPSGNACHNFVQLSLACRENPASAYDLICKGHLETFVAGQGRTDLAAVAHAAARIADPELRLDEFVSRLPVPLAPAKLNAEATTIDLGVLHVGEDRHFELTLRNKGERLLIGSASAEVAWLSLGDGPAAASKVFQFMTQNILAVRVIGSRLHAFDKPLEGQIVLNSNGGTVTVTVRVVVPVKPFAEGILSGALSPRQLAHKAKEGPKEAGALIESGAVARWYQANGWTYPVAGPAATGVAAVQQLFEALGLVKPPKVELSEDAIHLPRWPGQKVEYVLTALTQENRDVSWRTAAAIRRCRPSARLSFAAARASCR